MSASRKDTSENAPSKRGGRILGIRELFKSRPLLMGIINVTPDSFSDGGEFFDPAAAIAHGEQLIAQGANILDIGGESTRPGGAVVVPVAEEIRRLSPVIAPLAERCFISVDTYKSATAAKALELGAKMVNDVSALRADTEMVKVVRDYRAFAIIMHSKETGSTPHVTDSPRDYGDVILEISEFFRERIDFALRAGLKKEQIVLDPGMGRFLSHDSKYSWELLARFKELCQEFRDFPIVIATSRKGFLGGGLPATRDPISQLTALIAWLQGGDIVRTHNVAMAREFFDIWQRIGERAMRHPSSREGSIPCGGAEDSTSAGRRCSASANR